MNKIRKYGFVAALIVLAMTAVPPNGTGGYSLTFPLLKGAFASETASDVIIQNARNEAEKLLSIRTAAWLKFTDDWNAYLTERATNPAAVAPIFANTAAYGPSGLVTDGYLPASFPSGSYTPTADGNELRIVTTVDSTTASLVPNFLPMAEVSEGTITFKITRPGATAEFNFFVEKNAVNAMGNGGTIEWLSGNGLVAANTLRGNTLSSQSGGPIAVSSPMNITGNTAVTGNLSVSGTGTVTGTLTAGNLTTAGTVSGANGNFTNLGATTLAGNMNAGGRNITGAGTVSGTSITATGAVTGATGNFSGTVTAGGLNLGSGSVTTTGTMSAGTMSATNGNFTNLGATTLAGNMNAGGRNITNAGTVSGTSLTASGAVTGATGSFSGSVSTGALTASSLNAGSGGVTGGTGTFTTMKANTIEGRSGTTITVAGALALGANTITTTGAGTFGTMNVTNTGTGAMTVAGRINAGSAAITGNLTAASGTVSGALTVGSLSTAGAVSGGTGTFTTLNATNLGRSINAAGYNITNAGTVSGTTGQFTNLTLNGRTGTAASPYNVYVENAIKASNSNLLGGVSLAALRAEIAASGGGVGSSSWVAPSNYSSAGRSLNTSEALLLTYGTVSGTVKPGTTSYPYIYINGSYWRGTVAALRAAMGIASTTRYVGFFAKNVVVSQTSPEGSDGYITSTSTVAGGLSWLDLNAVGTRTLYIPAGTVFSFKK